jgi:hypothetical protein
MKAQATTINAAELRSLPAVWTLSVSIQGQKYYLTPLDILHIMA